MKHREQPDETIEGKVAAAVERRIAPLLEGISKQIATLPPPRPAKAALEPEDRFVAIGKAAMVLGVHKATCLRYEDEGRLPPRRMMGGRTGWLMSELRALLKSLPPASQGRRPANFDNAH